MRNGNKGPNRASTSFQPAYESDSAATMNDSILSAFIADQRKAKTMVAANLDVEENINAYEWASQFSKIRKSYHAVPFADVFVPHGIGLELKIGDLYIDYDYSTTGRCDGFDAWRIFVYMTKGKFDCVPADDQLQHQVDEWFQQLKNTQQIVQLDNLYYINPTNFKLLS